MMTNPSDEQTPRTQPDPEDGELEEISRLLQATAPKDPIDLQAREVLRNRLLERWKRWLRRHSSE